MRSQPMTPGVPPQPRALLKLLRRRSDDFLRSYTSTIDTSAALLQVARQLPGNTAPFCFILVSPDRSLQLSAFHFMLHASEVELREICSAKAFDEALCTSIAERLSDGRLGLTAVIGILNSPGHGVSREAGSLWQRLNAALRLDWEKAEARKLRRYRESLLQVNEVATQLRGRLPLEHGGRVVEAVYDPKLWQTQWDIGGVLDE